MKKNSVILGMVLMTTVFANAQEVDLKDLKTPNSPGFQLLDIAPSNIERPTNPKALAIGIFSLTNNGTALPKNFSFEMSPYWYTRNSDASIFKYLNIAKDGKQHNFTGILNKLSISAASSFSDSTKGSLLKNTNYISVGARTNLFTFRTAEQNDKMKKAIASIANRFDKLLPEDKKNKADLKIATQKLKGDTLALRKKIAGETIAMNRAEANHNDSLKNISAALIKQYQEDFDETVAKIADAQALRDEMDSSHNSRLAKAIKEDKQTQAFLTELNAPPLFQIDVAYAYAWAFPGNAFAEKRFNRSALWLNGTLAGSTNKTTNVVSLTVSCRLMNDNILADTLKNSFVNKSSFDIGGKLEYATESFSFSFEYMKRSYHNITLVGNERSVGLIQYKLSDGVFLVGSFGKNFGQANNLFTVFGINWGFGKTAVSGKALKQ